MLASAGISPAWEDPACANGGRWVIKLDKVPAGGVGCFHFLSPVLEFPDDFAFIRRVF